MRCYENGVSGFRRRAARPCKNNLKSDQSQRETKKARTYRFSRHDSTLDEVQPVDDLLVLDFRWVGGSEYDQMDAIRVANKMIVDLLIGQVAGKFPR